MTFIKTMDFVYNFDLNCWTTKLFFYINDSHLSITRIKPWCLSPRPQYLFYQNLKTTAKELILQLHNSILLKVINGRYTLLRMFRTGRVKQHLSGYTLLHNIALSFFLFYTFSLMISPSFLLCYTITRFSLDFNLSAYCTLYFII